MVRAPCCEKMGVKKGPWSPEEDQILVSYIHQHGHGNWRALPKQAGLLRCGKSCRLRWTNYLRPDIKRGNFSKEEEESIITLHEELGNRWSAIAASLPGRTDNEIKNVWHTHLKKKLIDHDLSSQCSKRHSIVKKAKRDTQLLENSDSSVSEQLVTSPQQDSSEISSITNPLPDNLVIKNEEMDYSSDYSPKIDETFWSDELSTEENNFLMSKENEKEEIDTKVPKNGIDSVEMDPINDESMDFWYNLFIRAGNMTDLPEF